MKSFTRVLLIVLSIILVLAMASCEPEKDKATCTSCKGSGLGTCPVVIAYVNHFGKKPTGHDCNQCTNGTVNCARCNGTGKIAND